MGTTNDEMVSVEQTSSLNPLCFECGQQHWTRENHLYNYQNEVDDDLVCHICLQPLLQPLDTPCGHTFCYKCLRNFLQEKDFCPLDRKKLHFKLCKKSSILVHKLLDKLFVLCPFSSVCQEVMQRCELEAHLKNRCPGASHRRVVLEKRKSSKLQTEAENENGPNLIDHPGTLSPDTDHAGTGPVPVDQNFTPTTLPSWTDEPGLDNPAFEESTIADSFPPMEYCPVRTKRQLSNSCIHLHRTNSNTSSICDIREETLSLTTEEATHQPPTLPEGEITTIEIHRSNPYIELGISIVGGNETPLINIVIQEVYRDGIIARDGRLLAGDQILQVNNFDISNVSHNRARAVLSQPCMVLHLTVLRERRFGSRTHNHADSTSLREDGFQVTLHKRDSSEQLGIKLVRRTDEPGVFILDLLEGGLAAQDGRLCSNDRVLAINGHDLKHGTPELAAQIIQASGERVNLTISRPVKSQTVAILREAGTHNSSQHQAQQLFHSRHSSHKILSQCIACQEKHITVKKEPHESLGMTVAGGRGSKSGELPIFVTSVQPHGCLARDGRIKRGDVLLNINGIDLTNLSHSEAVAMLKASATSSVVALKTLEVQIVEEQTQTNEEQPSTISENEYDASWSPSWIMWLGLPSGLHSCHDVVLRRSMESIERDEAKSLIERYGGKVTGNVSKKTNYLIMGRDCGQSKCEKASTLGTKIIHEDGLFDLIRTMPGKKSKYELAAEAEAKKAKSKWDKTPQKTEPEKRKISPAKKETDPKKSNSTLEKGGTFRSIKKETTEAQKGLNFKQQAMEKKHAAKPEESCVPEISKDRAEGLLWVDKYKPTSLKTVIGQQGDQSCANKLLRWLRNWHKNTSEDKHAKPSKSGGKEDGTNFKAALLSGPPGVGKTTTAALVCEELGYSYVELNASDTRSKNSLKDVVAESLNNTSMKDFCSGTSHSVSMKHVLIMDEVDGMAGNEDRGGIQELIGLIKTTKIPIICMCNDRNHPKIRSLVHYCFDLRFQRPRLEQIKGAMMSIAFKEGLKIPAPAMNEIILAANQDIRQVLHNLSMWCTKNKSLTYDEAKADASKAKKDIKLGPFDVVRKVFTAGEETAHMSLIDKSDLFFYDYSLAPLFVQENYVHVKPVAARGNMKKHLMLLSRAADSICDGDLVDKQIRSKQNWNLLPTQAIYSSVLPGELMRGYMSQFPNFPGWLGKFSSTGKHDRIVQELAMHMSLRTHTSKRAVNMEYLSYLRDALVKPLTSLGTEGVQDAVTFMDSYCLMREDVENIMEISSWGGKPSPFSKLDPKVKAAFTRAYNKEAHLTPYALHAVKTSKRQPGPGLASEVNEELNADELQSDEDEQDPIESDAMIKQKKAKSSKPSKSANREETKKGKGKGKK